jgi:radical SAM protein with 4Fe4S-binding SPASM domain
MSFNGLARVNVELTSKCNKNCWMCGRRKIDKEYPSIAMNYGHMDFELVKEISKQLPENIMVQFHWNGEGLLYPKFGDAINLFHKQIRCMDTNGKLIVEKADEIINNLDTMTMSVIERDSEGDEQYELVKKFLTIRKNRRPRLIYRCLGNVDIKKWADLDGMVVKRILHHPLGSFKYKKEVTKPEAGICMDFLNTLAIDRFGDVSLCVRFDPKRLGVLGNLNEQTLKEIWSGSKRKKWLQYHIDGRRDLIPLCSYCEFWGIPKG